MGDVFAAEATAKGAVVEGTNAKQLCAWSRYKRYLSLGADFVLERLVKPSSQSPSEPPWTVYHRSLSWLTDKTPDSTEMENLHYFYNDSFGDIGI
jgi:hypothetical protein